MVYRRADEYEQALPLLSEAVEVARASGDQSAVADSLYHVGSVYWSRGENKQAAPIHQEALDMSRTLDLRDLVAVQATHGRAEVYLSSGRPDLALPLFEESLRLSRQVGDRSYEAENLQMISTVSRGPDGLADYRAAWEAGEEALAICRAAHLDWHMVAVLDCLSAAGRGLGDYQIAFCRSREAAHMAVDINVPRLLSFVFYQLAVLYQDLGLLEQAETYLRRALQVSEEVGSAFFLPIIRAGLSVTCLRKGDLSVNLSWRRRWHRRWSEVKIGRLLDVWKALLYVLVVAGLLTVEDGKFSNTIESDHFLVRGKPAYLGSEADLTASNWSKILKTAETIRAGDPPGLIDYHDPSQDELIALLRGLYPDVVVDAGRLMEQYDFSTHRTLLHATSHFKYMAPQFLYKTRFAPRGSFCWAFIIEKIEDGQSRLISWWQAEGYPKTIFKLPKPFVTLVDSTHQKQFLKGIKKRVETRS